MTKEEGKRKKRKKWAGNQAGNRPSAEEAESSKQLEGENEENMQTATANEAGKKRGRGRPRLLLTRTEIQRLSPKMTEEEGKGKKRKKQAANEAENRPSAEEEESSKQLEEEKVENTQSGSANEAGNKQGLGQPQDLISEEEMKIRNEKKIKRVRDRDYRANIRLEHEAYKVFCEMPGIIDMFKAFSEEYMRKINEETSEGAAEQEPELEKSFKQLDKYFMLERQVHKAFCKMPGINDMFKPFNEEFMKINAESLKGVAGQEPGLTEDFEELDENFMVSKFIRKWLELFKKFFEEVGTTEKFKAVCLKVKEEEEGQHREEIDKPLEVSEDLSVTLDENLESEMIRTVGVESVTAVNSSSFGAIGTPFERAMELKRRKEELDEARWGKRPATGYIPPSHTPIGGFMAEACQNDHQSAAALANREPTFSTNEGTQIQTKEAACDKEALTSSWAPPLVELRKFL